MNRKEANTDLLDILHNYFERYPDQRFIQGLHNLGISERYASYYIESADLLERVLERKKYLIRIEEMEKRRESATNSYEKL